MTKADAVGAASLAYSMAYAVNDGYDTNAIKEDWILREDNGSNWQRDFGSQWWVQVPPQHAQAPEPHDDDERQQPGLTRLHHWPIRDPEE